MKNEIIIKNFLIPEHLKPLVPGDYDMEITAVDFDATDADKMYISVKILKESTR